jgi:peptidyl-tRNA hydrolase, PTH1 family
VNWVLSNFQPDEIRLLEDVIRVAADAATQIVKIGAKEAQGQFNGVDLRPKPPEPTQEPVPERLEGNLET